MRQDLFNSLDETYQFYEFTELLKNERDYFIMYTIDNMCDQ